MGFSGNIWRIVFALAVLGTSGCAIRPEPMSERAFERAADINIASGNDFDSMGNLFQSNFGGDRISRIDQSGVVTNLTSFVDGPVGIVIDADDNLYVSSCLDNQVIRITPDDMASLFVGSTQFNCPNGITQAPNGDFYMINWHSGDIFRITPAGEFSLFASVPPEGGHVTIAGDRLYATSPGTGRIFGFQLEGDNAGELVQRIGAGGVGSADGTYFVAQFNRPNGLTADATGEILYVTDQNGVRRIALEDEAEPPPPPPPPPPATPPAPPASSGGGGSVAWGLLIALGGLAIAKRRRRSVS